MVAFPGIFKGALEGRATQITEEMKLAAAEAIAGLVPEDQLKERKSVVEGKSADLGGLGAIAEKSHIRR